MIWVHSFVSKHFFSFPPHFCFFFPYIKILLTNFFSNVTGFHRSMVLILNPALKNGLLVFLFFKKKKKKNFKRRYLDNSVNTDTKICFLRWATKKHWNQINRSRFTSPTTSNSQIHILPPWTIATRNFMLYWVPGSERLAVWSFIEERNPSITFYYEMWRVERDL